MRNSVRNEKRTRSIDELTGPDADERAKAYAKGPCGGGGGGGSNRLLVAGSLNYAFRPRMVRWTQWRGCVCKRVLLCREKKKPTFLRVYNIVYANAYNVYGESLYALLSRVKGIIITINVEDGNAVGSAHFKFKMSFSK